MIVDTMAESALFAVRIAHLADGAGDGNELRRGEAVEVTAMQGGEEVGG